MLKSLTVAEEQMLTGLFNPKCFAETLFTEGVPDGWLNGEPCVHIRLYQLPFLQYDTVIEDDNRLTRQQNFDLRKIAGELFVICGRLIGKCEEENQECLLASGKMVTFKNLVNKSAKVLVLDETKLKIKKSLAKFFNNGIKECFELITESGKITIKTENHPFFTADGWKSLKDLKVGEYITTPREYPNLGNLKVDKNIAKLLGYLLGDGSCTTNHIGFTNINEELLKEYYELADYFDCSLTKIGIDYFVKRKIFNSDKNDIYKLVLKYGINKKSKYKEIPKQVFLWHKDSIAILLNRLFACDGHINKTCKHIELTLASKKMIYQIQHLLLRLGIYSSIYEKKATCNGKVFKAWRLFIIKDFNKFLDVVGIKSKDMGFRKNPKYRIGDNIPQKLFLNLYNQFKGFYYHLKLRKMKFSRKKTSRT